MPGYPSIKNAASRSLELLAHEQTRALLASGVVGVVIGACMPHIRLGLGLPGHKALFWMIPIIVARITLRSPAGATTGVLAAAFTSLAGGGHFAGSALHLPLVGAAGIMLDVTIGFAERRALALSLMIPLLGAAGLMANLICFVKRGLPPSSIKPHLVVGLSAPWGSLASYVSFGLLAGLIGATLGCAVRRRRKPPPSRRP